MLGKYAFPRIQEALDKRQKAIEEAIEAAERARAEADKLLAEYRQRLREAREQAEEIVVRARKAAEEHERESLQAARQQREELLEQTRRDVEAETCRAIQEIRNEVADLTVLATEKVTRKTLTAEDQQRLVEEALAELDFSALAGERSGTGVGMEEIAQVYSRSLFEVAKEHGKLDSIKRAAGPVRRCGGAEPRAGGVLLLALLLDRGEEGGAARVPSRARTPEFVNFLELLIENHRMPVHLPHPARSTTCCGTSENRRLPVEVTSAVELDHGDRRRARRPDRRADRPERGGRRSKVDPDILGGIVLRVGNSILDASIRNRLDQLRKKWPKPPRGSR